MAITRLVMFAMAVLAVGGFVVLGSSDRSSCGVLGRPLNDDELIALVSSKKAVGDYQIYFLGADNEDQPSRLVDRYDTVQEFLAAYPACCEVYRSGKQGFEPSFDFWRWISRETWPIVGITYPKFSKFEDGSMRQKTVREYFETNPCGEIVEIT